MKKAMCVMIQGTMSDAGKSVVAAGLCRVFRQDGYKVAPFKSQNMALNSYVTRDGKEMGRAQVMQAEAAMIEPDVRMNPILLKPSSDTGSQIIVLGEIRDEMSAVDYFRFKHKLFPEVKKAFDELAEENDIIVIEGAGSPAEINLREDDIANMGMAQMVDAPVLLVGDIDRGGVFAQLYGTAELMLPEEKARIEGLVINKFRGDPEILRPGLSMLEEKTGIPVLGVIPMLKVDLDDEDSLAPRLTKEAVDRPLDICVVRVPRLSNFTDFSVLEEHPAIGVRYARRPEELKEPDLVVLPGTKNTMDDLVWLRESGMEAKILQAADRGTPVLGVCGGYQMLGEELYNPEHTEGDREYLHGLGLLPVTTTFTPEKTRTRVQGEVVSGPLAGAALDAYEIHMGETIVRGEDFCRLTDGSLDGCFSGNCYGTYLHGLFDTGALTEKLAIWLAECKGIDIDDLKPMDHRAYAQREYDKLADGVRAALDIEKIYEIMREYQRHGEE